MIYLALYLFQNEYSLSFLRFSLLFLRFLILIMLFRLCMLLGLFFILLRILLPPFKQRYFDLFRSLWIFLWNCNCPILSSPSQNKLKTKYIFLPKFTNFSYRFLLCIAFLKLLGRYYTHYLFKF